MGFARRVVRLAAGDKCDSSCGHTGGESQLLLWRPIESVYLTSPAPQELSRASICGLDSSRRLASPRLRSRLLGSAAEAPGMVCHACERRFPVFRRRMPAQHSIPKQPAAGDALRCR